MPLRPALRRNNRLMGDPPKSTRSAYGHVRVPSLVLFLLSALLTSCVRSEPPADLTIINFSEPQSLDPAIISAQPDLRIVAGIFEGLTRVDPHTGAAIPGLAERWDLSSDGRVYTFHLRTNLVWSTGEPLRAGD